MDIYGIACIGSNQQNQTYGILCSLKNTSTMFLR